MWRSHEGAALGVAQEGTVFVCDRNGRGEPKVADLQQTAGETTAHRRRDKTTAIRLLYSSEQPLSRKPIAVTPKTIHYDYSTASAVTALYNYLDTIVEVEQNVLGLEVTVVDLVSK